MKTRVPVSALVIVLGLVITSAALVAWWLLSGHANSTTAAQSTASDSLSKSHSKSHSQRAVATRQAHQDQGSGAAAARPPGDSHPSANQPGQQAVELEPEIRSAVNAMLRPPGQTYKVVEDEHGVSVDLGRRAASVSVARITADGELIVEDYTQPLPTPASEDQVSADGHQTPGTTPPQ